MQVMQKVLPKVVFYNMPFSFLWSPQLKQKLSTTCLIITLILAELT